jgi:hypothetical protein
MHICVHDSETRKGHNPNNESFWWSIEAHEPERRLWLGWSEFFLRPWHYRLWTVQETTLARHVEQVLCGELNFDWFCLQSLPDYFTLPCWRRYFQLRSMSHSNIMPYLAVAARVYFENSLHYPVEWQRDLTLKWGNSSLGSNFAETLNSTRRYQCSNPRDTI